VIPSTGNQSREASHILNQARGTPVRELVAVVLPPCGPQRAASMPSRTLCFRDRLFFGTGACPHGGFPSRCLPDWLRLVFLPDLGVLGGVAAWLVGAVTGFKGNTLRWRKWGVCCLCSGWSKWRFQAHRHRPLADGYELSPSPPGISPFWSEIVALRPGGKKKKKSGNQRAPEA